MRKTRFLRSPAHKRFSCLQYSIRNRFLKTVRQKKRKMTVPASGPPPLLSAAAPLLSAAAPLLSAAIVSFCPAGRPWRILRRRPIRRAFFHCGERKRFLTDIWQAGSPRICVITACFQPSYKCRFLLVFLSDGMRFALDFSLENRYSISSSPLFFPAPLRFPECSGTLYLHTGIISRGWQPWPAVIPTQNT